jgi:DNA-binding NarL/FixJ family response regulator
MLRVLVIDDHAVVRVGLRLILRSTFQDVSVGEACNGTEGLAEARKQAWDVVVLDITMPGINGLEVLKQLKRDFPQLPVIILSMHSGSHYVSWSFKAGASGYVTKENAPDELVPAMEAVLAGHTYASPALMESAGLVS